MDRLDFVPLLNSYQVVVADDVVRTDLGGLPQWQRLATALPYRVDVEFLLNGADHEALLAFWQKNRAKRFLMQLLLADSRLDWCPCVFATSPVIEPLGGKLPWSDDEIRQGTADTSHHHYRSRWQVFAMQAWRYDDDLAVIEAFERDFLG